MKQHLLALPTVGQRELTTIGTGIILSFTYIGWISIECVRPGITNVLVDTVAMSVQLEQSRHREVLPLGVIIPKAEEVFRSILMVLHKTETPHAFHGQVTL